mgnify:CR=1 FL=1
MTTVPPIPHDVAVLMDLFCVHDYPLLESEYMDRPLILLFAFALWQDCSAVMQDLPKQRLGKAKDKGSPPFPNLPAKAFTKQ